MTPEESTLTVYRDDLGCHHLPGPNPGTQYTKCLLDTGVMERREHPSTHAALWCGDCFRAAAEGKPNVSI